MLKVMSISPPSSLRKDFNENDFKSMGAVK